MKPKILIDTEGGVIQFISTNMEADIVIVDHDLVDYGESPVKRYEPDTICENQYENYSDDNYAEVRDELKRIHF